MFLPHLKIGYQNFKNRIVRYKLDSICLCNLNMSSTKKILFRPMLFFRILYACNHQNFRDVYNVSSQHLFSSNNTNVNTDKRNILLYLDYIIWTPFYPTHAKIRTSPFYYTFMQRFAYLSKPRPSDYSIWQI